MRPIFLFGLSSILLAQAANPPWNLPGACMTPQGTVCRTVRWEYATWAAGSWFLALQRGNGSHTLAYRRDGASLDWATSRFFRNYLTPVENGDVSIITLPVQHQTISIFHADKSCDVSGVLGAKPTAWNPNDPDCRQGVNHLSELKRVGEVVIAGVRSIEYAGRGSSTSRTTVALAPSLGCMEMRNVYRDYNRLGLPTAFSEAEVVSVQIGEPDPALFQVPKGYHQVNR